VNPVVIPVGQTQQLNGAIMAMTDQFNGTSCV